MNNKREIPTKCEICGRTPCFPWSDKHEDDFQKEIDQAIDEYRRPKCHECKQDDYHDLGCSQFKWITRERNQ